MSDSSASGSPPSGPSTPNRPKPERRGWWRRWYVRAVLILAGLGVAGVLSFLLLLGVGLAMAYPNLPDIKGLTDYRPRMPLRVYSSDQVLIGEFGEEKRDFLPIDQIPKVMRDAVLAIEDARFYHHGGVDYVGVIRAGLANFGEARSQGASTITMQVARNFYLPTEKTLTRKIYEILLALKIESLLGKDQILELYMNQIYLGQRAYGFAAASETYFGKPLKDISVAEAAMLAGLPKAPSAYNPIHNPQRARIRQQYIIDRMYENGFITLAQKQQAKGEELHYLSKPTVPMHAEYAAEAARALMHDQYGEEAYSRGLNVYTSINMAQQEQAYHALRRGLLNYDRRQAWRGPEAYVDLPGDPDQLDVRIAEALEDHPDSDDMLAAVVTATQANSLTAMLQDGDEITVEGEGLRAMGNALTEKASPKLQVRRGAIIRVVQDKKTDKWSVTQIPDVQGAFVSMDPRTGLIETMVGGFDFNRNKFNHVTQAWRQPGSSFKPFIYSSALEKGFTPATVVNDAPLFFDAGVTGGQPWEPKNYDGKYEGPMTLRRGLAKSKNMISIRVLRSVGVHYAQDWITRFGFDADRHPAYLTMALGAGSVTPLQMADAYSVFANGGYRVNPELITQVTDSRGKMLANYRPAKLDEHMRVIDARNAFVMCSLLQEVTRSGTAARAQATLKRPDLYGKTGTTNDSMDAWFSGFTLHKVAIVWIGHDQPHKLGDHETGGGLALPVWIDFMGYALRNAPVQEPSPPDGVVNIAGEWYYEEYTPSTGVKELNQDGEDAEHPAPASATPEERRGILDLFGNKSDN